MLCKYTKHCLLLWFHYNRHHLHMLPVMCVKGCVHLFSRLQCSASQNSGYFTFLWSCIIVFLSQSHRWSRCVFLFCISLGKSHSRTVISVICVMVVVCPPIFYLIWSHCHSTGNTAMQARHIRKSIVGTLISPRDFLLYSFMQREALLSRWQCPTYNLVFRLDNMPVFYWSQPGVKCK